MELLGIDPRPRGKGRRVRVRPLRGPAGQRSLRARLLAGHVDLDAEGSVRGIDAPFAAMLGYAPDALVGAFYFAYIHGRDLAPILREAAELLQDRRATATWTFRFQSAEGEWRGLTARVERSGAGLRLTLAERRGATRGA